MYVATTGVLFSFGERELVGSVVSEVEEEAGGHGLWIGGEEKPWELRGGGD